jgi:hypothetical protein
VKHYKPQVLEGSNCGSEVAKCNLITGLVPIQSCKVQHRAYCTPVIEMPVEFSLGTWSRPFLPATKALKTWCKSSIAVHIRKLKNNPFLRFLEFAFFEAVGTIRQIDHYRSFSKIYGVRIYDRY